jgi:hypothetical protein
MLPVDAGDGLPLSCTIEHLIPKGGKGLTTQENTRAACYSCNHLRSRYNFAALGKAASEIYSLKNVIKEKQKTIDSLTSLLVKYLSSPLIVRWGMKIRFLKEKLESLTVQ